MNENIKLELMKLAFTIPSAFDKSKNPTVISAFKILVQAFAETEPIVKPKQKKKN